MFIVLAHVYHGHFKEIVLLNLNSHLNCLFSHLILFNDTFKLVTEDKDFSLESLVEDVYALNMAHFDPIKLNNQTTTVTQQLTTTVTTTQQMTTGKSSPSQSSSSMTTNATKGLPSNPSPTMDGSQIVPAKSLKHSPSHSPSAVVNPVTSPISTPCPPSIVTAMEISSGVTPAPSPSIIQQQPCPSSTITPPSTPGQSAAHPFNSRMEID